MISLSQHIQWLALVKGIGKEFCICLIHIFWKYEVQSCTHRLANTNLQKDNKKHGYIMSHFPVKS